MSASFPYIVYILHEPLPIKENMIIVWWGLAYATDHGFYLNPLCCKRQKISVLFFFKISIIFMAE